MILYLPPAVLTAAPEEPFLRRQSKGDGRRVLECGHPTGGQKTYPTGGSDVHTEELQERHRGKGVLMNQSREEGKSPAPIKPGREALMDGAANVVFQKYHWARCCQEENQSKRVAELVACFESWLASDRHYSPQPVAAIKLPSEKGLRSSYNYLPTSRAAKQPLLPPASLQAHKEKSQTGFIHFAAIAQTSVGKSVGPDTQETSLHQLKG